MIAFISTLLSVALCSNFTELPRDALQLVHEHIPVRGLSALSKTNRRNYYMSSEVRKRTEQNLKNDITVKIRKMYRDVTQNDPTDETVAVQLTMCLFFEYATTPDVKLAEMLRRYRDDFGIFNWARHKQKLNLTHYQMQSLEGFDTLHQRFASFAAKEPLKRELVGKYHLDDLAELMELVMIAMEHPALNPTVKFMNRADSISKAHQLNFNWFPSKCAEFDGLFDDTATFLYSKVLPNAIKQRIQRIHFDKHRVRLTEAKVSQQMNEFIQQLRYDSDSELRQLLSLYTRNNGIPYVAPPARASEEMTSAMRAFHILQRSVADVTESVESEGASRAADYKYLGELRKLLYDSAVVIGHPTIPRNGTPQFRRRRAMNAYRSTNLRLDGLFKATVPEKFRNVVRKIEIFVNKFIDSHHIIQLYRS